MTVRMLLKLQTIQMTTDCRKRLRAKCNHVLRPGGLPSIPTSPPTSVFHTSVATITNHEIEEVNDDLFNEIDALSEFDDFPEADMIRKCSESDRTGGIPECTRVRNYGMTFRIFL